MKRGVKRGQGGFALLELAVAVVLTSLILIWGANRVAQQIDDATARATGIWLLEIKRGLDDMLRQHFDSLADGISPTGVNGLPLYRDSYAPQLAELKQQGHLPSGFPETVVLGGKAGIRIFRHEKCRGQGCRLDALAYSLQPLQTGDGSAPDQMKIGAALEAIGGYGGTATQHRIRGATFNFVNPPAPQMASLPAGTLVVWAGLGGADRDVFVRRRDKRDPDLKGALSVAGRFSASERVHTDEYLSVGGVAASGAACPTSRAALVARSPEGALLTCRSGTWRAADGGFGGAFSRNNRFGCRHYSGVSTANPLTGECSCPNGYSAVVVSAGGKWSEREGWTTGYICVR